MDMQFTFKMINDNDETAAFTRENGKIVVTYEPSNNRQEFNSIEAARKHLTLKGYRLTRHKNK